MMASHVVSGVFQEMGVLVGDRVRVLYGSEKGNLGHSSPGCLGGLVCLG